MNIEEAIIDIQNMAKRSLEKMAELRGIEAKLSKACAGTMPRRMLAETKKLKDIQVALEKDDSWFIEQLATISGTKDPIQSMLNIASVVAKLDDAGRRLDGRISKLSERISAYGPAESQTAIQLKSNLVDTRKVIDKRIGVALGKFFATRLYAINAVLKLTSKVCGLWKDGSVAVRASALDNSALQAIESLASWERVATQGVMSTGGTNGRSRIKI